MKLLVDLDGCLSDFLASALSIFGYDLYDQSEVGQGIRQRLLDNQKNTEPSPDIYLFVSKKQFWKEIDRAGHEFWTNLPLLPWAKELWAKLNEEYPESVYFCTSPSNHPDSSYGKAKWIWKHFKTNKFVLTNHKYLLAKPDTILVDDTPKKLRKFEEHGGLVYKWPHQLILMGHDLDPSIIVGEQIEAIKQSIALGKNRENDE